MSLSLLTPLFLAGLGLMLVPWLIHRIQRPERRPVRFSSLLFIPRMDREVVQRRRLQHLLLLLMRMAVLALLAFAFSRPFVPSGNVAVAGSAAETLHVVLLDRSLSMGTEDWMQEARTRAKERIDAIPENEPVAVVAFDASAEVLHPFAEDGATFAADRKHAARVVDAVEVSQRGTSYPVALQAARRLLQKAGADGVSRRGIIYLISDLQEEGFGPDTAASRRLPPGIEIRPVAVGREAAPNRAVTEVAVRPVRDGEFRVAGKVKNWTMDSDERFPVTLYVEGRERTSEQIAVLRHHATQVAFEIDGGEARGLKGWIEIAADALEADNRRYFAWNPPPRRTVAVLTRNRGAEAWPSGWFARSALKGAATSAYEVEALAVEDAVARLGSTVSRPDVLIAGELSGKEADLNRAVLQFLKTGGRAILTLSPEAQASELNAGLLEAFQLRAMKSADKSAGANAYRLMRWIDFEHPVFQPFRAPQYNDFSAIRVFNHVGLELDARSAGDRAAPRALIQLEGGEGQDSPALVEVAYGAGGALVWTFPHDPRVTNLPKSARYAPIVLESVRYLTRSETIQNELSVGGAIDLEAGAGRPELSTADGRTLRPEPADPENLPFVIEEAGLMRIPGAGGSPDRTLAVNVDPEESNPVRLSEEAFRSRVMTPRPHGSEVEAESPVLAGDGRGPRGPGREFGLALLIAVAGLLFVELWYAPRLVG